MNKQSMSDIPALDQLRAEFARVASADAESPRSPRVRPRLVALALLTFVAAATTVVALRSISGDRAREQAAAERRGGDAVAPPAPAFAGHGDAYTNVGQLIRASDLILIGTVEDSVVAEVVGEGPDDAFPTRTLHTTIAVEEELRGAAPDSRIVVRTDELAFRGPGIEDWRQPERRVLLFLTRSSEVDRPGFYVPANLAFLQTAFFARGDEIEMTVGGDVNGLSQRIAAMRLPELRERARSASG